MRSRLARSVYRSLVLMGAPQLARRLRRGALVLCFHNVVSEADSGSGDASLHMPVRAFETIVGWLAATYEAVSLSELADRVDAGRSLRGLAAVTFDDAYRGIFEHALPVLARAGLPCTIFVVSGFADRPVPTWWDTLASRGLLSEARRDKALAEQRGLAEDVLSGHGRAPGECNLPEDLIPAPWERIIAAAGDSVSLGSHTVRHPNLTALSSAELDEELARSRREIGERTGRQPDALAYPYGLWNERVLRAMGPAGYRIGLTLEGAPFAGQDLLAAPRLNVPAGISSDALACWAVGLRPGRPW